MCLSPSPPTMNEWMNALVHESLIELHGDRTGGDRHCNEIWGSQMKLHQFKVMLTKYYLLLILIKLSPQICVTSGDPIYDMMGGIFVNNKYIHMLSAVITILSLALSIFITLHSISNWISKIINYLPRVNCLIVFILYNFDLHNRWMEDSFG